MKPKKQMTNEEYEAKAMLLGMEYYRELHVLADIYNDGDPSRLHRPAKYFDPDTLKVIDVKFVWDRRGRWRGG